MNSLLVKRGSAQICYYQSTFVVNVVMKLVTGLYIYPVKSLGGIEVNSANVTLRGLEYDRRWMLVDEQHQFLTQRTFPQLALLRTAINHGRLNIFELGNPGNIIDLELVPLAGMELQVQIWEDECTAWHINPTIDSWFSEKLNRRVKLVYMPDSSLRQVDLNYARPGDITGFADGYPVLIIGQSSLDDLNSRLSEPVPMQRFRPNIVFTGGTPFEEDSMSKFHIGDIEFYGVKPCGRCEITTVDQDRGVAGKEPLRTLSTYRVKNNKVMFGQNVICANEGPIQVGEHIRE
jgi:uncharacterized protein YcbX